MHNDISHNTKTLYVSDLDGTLLGADSRISDATAHMLNEAIDRGAMFTVATARTPATVAGLMKDVRLKLPAVVMTGAAMWDTRSGRYSAESLMDSDTAYAIADEYRRRGLPAFVYMLGEDSLIHIWHLGPLDSLERKFVQERMSSPYKRFHIDGEWQLPPNLSRVALFYSMQPTSATKEVYEALRLRGDCSPVFYHDLYGPDTAIMEVFAPGTSKAEAICRLRRITGAGRVVVFGDNINDLPMMRVADRAIAVGNAVDEVKATAHEVTGPNTADSVARWILDDIDNNL